MASGPIQRDLSFQPKLGLLERAVPYGVVAIASWPKPRACSLNFLSLELDERMRRHDGRHALAAAARADSGAAA